MTAMSAKVLEPTDASTHLKQPEQTRTSQPLPSAASLRQQLPLMPALATQIQQQRQQVRDILHGKDDRLLLVVGPCSIHDEHAALTYAERLSVLAEAVADELLLVMRAYVEKPRTTVGWKGLLYDPERNGSGDMAQGVQRSRQLLLELAAMGLPVATEALNPLAMHYLDDLVSWTAVGARTTESQIHREMVSGLPMPTGFKNGTDGSIQTAIHAMQSAAHSHHHLGLCADGQPAMLLSPGNPDTHLVLRGGRGITNYDAASIEAAVAALHAAGVNPAVMVDCSHDNAQKQHERQISIAEQVAGQRHAGNRSIRGLMLESFLLPGRQADSGELMFGCSLTDPCLGWDDTASLIRRLAG
ncbi:3-deoxy-7-phosphoheptulonate synthase [Halopseudomonas salegens]|uniref:Phospho-2-dehydro-3-deoxyheptonate aldolase n=2 Tax=Halopseudomonas salegens TaxID=1434072 RepID=A0A1H2F3C8_9GAMM|nr:3-deoxy-7-phosphoheptulonate synthase [Halopseudomonas salegens]SDU01874.1 3-deoxy-D-arabinoheptulosonate-7-phosphate synthase [Halopseudomonas salegens]